MRRARVVLQQEAAQQLGLAHVRGAVERVTVVADHLSLAHVSDLDEDVTALARVGDQVLVIAAVDQHLLAVGDALDRLQLIAITRGILKVEPPRGVVHAIVQLAHQHVRPALHEQRDLLDARLVILGADALLAGSRAALDVEVQAYLALLEDLIRARPERQQLADGFHGPAQRLGRRVGPEVKGAIVLDPARVQDSGINLVDRQLQVEVVLVVLQADVEAGAVVLDEVAFEDQRLDLVRALDELEVEDALDHLLDSSRLGVAGREVLPKPVAQAQGFADIDDLRLGVSKQVNARVVGHRTQALPDGFLITNGHAMDCRNQTSLSPSRERVLSRSDAG